jgi:hypothetical protein
MTTTTRSFPMPRTRRALRSLSNVAALAIQLWVAWVALHSGLCHTAGGALTALRANRSRVFTLGDLRDFILRQLCA